MKNSMAVMLVLLVAATAGCGRKEDATAPAPEPQAEVAAPAKSLYDRLGGEAAIKAVVDEFVPNVGADPRINQFFANANLDRLKGHLVNQIGQASGGPQQYTGRDMKT